MGHVTVKVSLSNPVLAGKGKVVEKAPVDTGATFTTVPEPIARKLGLKSIGKRRVKTAARSQILNESFAHIAVNGRSTVTPLLISRTLDKVLIGVITLEALGLSVDPTKGTLKESETLLLSQA
jgi:aspartyl protease family protein